MPAFPLAQGSVDAVKECSTKSAVSHRHRPYSFFLAMAYQARLKLTIEPGVLYQSMPPIQQYRVSISYQPYAGAWCPTTEMNALRNAIDWIAVEYERVPKRDLERYFSVTSKVFYINQDPSEITTEQLSIEMSEPQMSFDCDLFDTSRDYAARLEDKVRETIEKSDYMRAVRARDA